MNRRQFAKALGAAAGVAALPGIACSKAPAAAVAAAATGAAPIRIDSNENPYGPSERARAAIMASVTEACRYPNGPRQATIAAIARHHGVGTDEVLLGCGSSEILRTADATFAGPGKSVIASEPTFEAVLDYAKLMQFNPVRVPATADHRHDLPAMAAAVNASTGLIYVCNPNNPTGTIVSQTEMETFLKRVPAATAVLVDEAYFEFVEDPSYGSVVAWLGRYPNLIVARTFSKVFGMAGMRLGYALAAPATIARMQPKELMIDANLAVMEAARASLDDADHIADQRQRNHSTRAWLVAELEKDRRRYIPAHANFMMIDVGGDVAPVVAAFKERQILVGRKFPAMPNWLRVSMGTPAEMAAFMTALRQIVPAQA